MSFYRKSYRPRRGGEEPEKCADPAKARARALDALASREMSSAQLYERLCARFTEQAAAAAVAEMVELDYVNDDRYAETRAHGLLMARKSRRAAAQNLRQKGLNSQQIEQAYYTEVESPAGDGSKVWIVHYSHPTNYLSPSGTHLLGTDDKGFDVFSRLMYGGRVSLTVGFGVIILELSLIHI